MLRWAGSAHEKNRRDAWRGVVIRRNLGSWWKKKKKGEVSVRGIAERRQRSESKYVRHFSTSYFPDPLEVIIKGFLDSCICNLTSEPFAVKLQTLSLIMCFLKSWQASPRVFLGLLCGIGVTSEPLDFTFSVSGNLYLLPCSFLWEVLWGQSSH